MRQKVASCFFFTQQKTDSPKPPAFFFHYQYLLADTGVL